MAASQASSRTALVTGATGFLGSHVARALADAGWRVLALQRGEADTALLEGTPVTAVEADVLDHAGLDAAVPQTVDLIVHCASHVSLWRRNGPEQLRVNVRGTRNIVRLALARRARLIHVSCAVAYGQHSGVIAPDTPRLGRNSSITFVRSKAMAETEVERGMRAGLDAVILNPAFLLGPRDRNGWSRMVRLVAQRRLPGVPGGGGSFCSVTDVAAAVPRAAETLNRGTRLLIGGVNVSYAGLAREIGTQLGHRRFLRPVRSGILQAYARLEEGVAPLLGRDPDVTTEAVSLLTGNVYCDARQAREQLGMAEVSLERMVADCIAWMREAGRL
ncbi:SDR family NAD(P)-dependent oxidoreductase [Algiphilus sp.]|uniref:SDR family NAD(P)-dependent oxidoreductase n=1 Tax=Algiphilus sp. TaxID=1872431 RepID=UPI0025BE4EE9|nr:SDR family NAD(P)-dependent oxidoreductase [Algiphilus sp.]MCK5770280.1 SDR family NAD(P)-dependent oxidoreductase [Algiphilus sp.]